jgi:hypothetical protein
VKYSKGWKYRIEEDVTYSTGIEPLNRVVLDYLTLEEDGALTLKAKRFVWNGVSGFPDVECLFTPAAFHDALYGLIADGYLPTASRKAADQCIVDMAKARGASSVLLWGVYRALRWVGWAAARTKVEMYESP